MENRRAFFKGIVAFAAGVVGAKVESYIPKEKETMLVSNTITVKGPDGKEYHPVVVAKTKIDETPIEKKVENVGIGMKFYIEAPKNQVRKLKI